MKKAKSPEDPMEYVDYRLDQAGKQINRVEEYLRGFTKSILYNTPTCLISLWTIFTVLVITAPLLIKNPDPLMRGTAMIVYLLSGFLQFCHQLPHRSIRILGTQMPVCARDVGIYLGVIFGFFAPLVRERMEKSFGSLRSVVLCSAPIVVDGVSQSVLGLRESSNHLRFVTGVIFAFGVLSYLTIKFKRRYPYFRGNVLKIDNLAASAFTAALISYVLLSYTAPYFSEAFLFEEDAVSAVTSHEGISPESYAAYYIPPRAPASLHTDPYALRYDDNVLSDLRNLNPELGGCGVGCPRLYNYSGMYGLWVVVVPKSKGEGGKVVYTNAAGAYYYIDARDGRILLKRKH